MNKYRLTGRSCSIHDAPRLFLHHVPDVNDPSKAQEVVYSHTENIFYQHLSEYQHILTNLRRVKLMEGRSLTEEEATNIERVKEQTDVLFAMLRREQSMHPANDCCE